MIGCITSRKYSRGFYIFTIIINIDTIVQSLTFDSLLIRTLVKFYRLDTIYGSVSEGAVDGRDMGQVVNRTRRGNGGGQLHIDKSNGGRTIHKQVRLYVILDVESPSFSPRSSSPGKLASTPRPTLKLL